MKRKISIILLILLFSQAQALIIDHKSSQDFDSIQDDQIQLAKERLYVLQIGSTYSDQIVQGMKAIATDTKYAYGDAISTSYLSFRTLPDGISGCQSINDCNKLNQDGDSLFYLANKNYLDQNPEINTILWLWTDISGQNIDLYINSMEKLIAEYPSKIFIFSTSNTDGSGESSETFLKNKKIKDYASENNKILFDFYDMEATNPSGESFSGKNVTWNLDYKKCKEILGGSGIESILSCSDKNWAEEWIANDSNQNSNLFALTSSISSCPNSDSTDSRKLNCAIKGSSAWSMWVDIAQLVSVQSLQECIESWSCSEWSECIDSTQTRLCIDQNSCKTYTQKPETTATCTSTQPGDDSTQPPINDTEADYEENYFDKIDEEIAPVELISEQIQDAPSVILESKNGQIIFKESVQINQADLTGRVLINHNRIYIDSKSLPELNKPARLELRNLTFKSPKILRNGQPCPNSICTFIEYKNGNLIFDVTKFSEYSAIEAPVCGDSKCDSVESCQLCPEDCGSCAQSFSSPKKNQTSKQIEYKLSEKKGAWAIWSISIIIIAFSMWLIIYYKKRKNKENKIKNDIQSASQELVDNSSESVEKKSDKENSKQKDNLSQKSQ